MKKEKYLLNLRFNTLPIRKSLRAECINHDILEFWCIIKIKDDEELSAKLYNIFEANFKQSKHKRYRHFINKMRQLDITFSSDYKELIFNTFKDNCYITYGIHSLNELDIYNLRF